MNKIRIFGIGILILALILRYYFDNNNYAFWCGAAAGMGGILALTGRIKRAG